MLFVEIFKYLRQIIQRRLIMKVLVFQSEMGMCVGISVDSVLHLHVPLDGEGICRCFFDERFVRMDEHLRDG